MTPFKGCSARDIGLLQDDFPKMISRAKPTASANGRTFQMVLIGGRPYFFLNNQPLLSSYASLFLRIFLLGFHPQFDAPVKTHYTPIILRYSEIPSFQCSNNLWNPNLGGPNHIIPSCPIGSTCSPRRPKRESSSPTTHWTCSKVTWVLLNVGNSLKNPRVLSSCW